MGAIGRVLLLAVVLIAAYLLFWPTGFDPVAWTPPDNPGRTGLYAENGALQDATLLPMEKSHGPEDVALGPDGLLYTGLEDGSVVRFRQDGSGHEVVANTGGRVAGLQFHPSGDLILCDVKLGLLAMSPDGEIRTLVAPDGDPGAFFADDLDIDSNGVIWFSDASRLHDYAHYALSFWAHEATGRLVSHDPATGETKVHVDDLKFANGVALGPGEEYVLVNESSGYRIRRYWLKGPKAGTNDMFLDGLPAVPDNIAYDGDGIFWVALPILRQAEVDDVAEKPFLRSVLYRLTPILGEAQAPLYGWVIGIDTDGNVVHNLQDPTGGIHLVTSVNRYGDALVIGSLAMPAVAVLPAP